MIRVFQDMEALSLAAAALFVHCAREASERGGMFSVALSGGHTPHRTYELLALPPLRHQVNWERTDIFWGDERCVPADDPRSNYGMASKVLLDHVPVPPERVHPIRCDKDPAQGAARYENLLKAHFAGRALRFDLVFLGLGENGHTASLFPGMPVLHEEERIVAPVHLEEEDFCRVTLTAPTINRATLVAFLVSGTSKASVLREILEGPKNSNRLPARLIRPLQGDILWFIDREAASGLESTKESSE